MKSLLGLIALISLVVVAVLCFNQGGAANARWQELNGINVEVDGLQLTLKELQEQRAAIITKTGGGGLKGALLRDVMADFFLMLKELPPEISVGGIAYDQTLTDNIDASAADNDLGLPFLGLTLTLHYSDYVAAVAVFLGWFAYSSLPIIVRRLDVDPGAMSIKLEIYGLKSRR